MVEGMNMGGQSCKELEIVKHSMSVILCFRRLTTRLGQNQENGNKQIQ